MRSVVLAVAVLAGASSTARAQGPIPFVSGGLSIGGALHDDHDNGFLVGGEVSGGIIMATTSDDGAESQPYWIGAYADVLSDYGSDTTRVSFGPEAGWRFLGLDGGVVRELGDEPAWGFAIRPSFTAGPISAFVRYCRFGDDHETSHVELGLLLKFPYAPGLKL